MSDVTESAQVRYIDRMKYQLVEDFWVDTGILFGALGVTEKLGGIIINYQDVTLFPDGMMLIKAGFPWDGASGTTKDTKSSMAGSLLHDALYMLIRHDKLPKWYRKHADELMRKRCVKDGMWRWRAWGWFMALRGFGAKAARKSSIRKIKTAP